MELFAEIMNLGSEGSVKLSLEYVVIPESKKCPKLIWKCQKTHKYGILTGHIWKI